MEIVMSASLSAPVKAREVNWLPWSVLKISGLLKRLSALFRASRQSWALWIAETRAVAEGAFYFFVEACGVKYDKFV